MVTNFLVSLYSLLITVQYQVSILCPIKCQFECSYGKSLSKTFFNTTTYWDEGGAQFAQVHSPYLAEQLLLMAF